MAINNNYNVILTGITGGSQIVSNFWYLQGDGVAAAVDLRREFISDILPTIKGIISASTQFIHLKVVNHENPIDFSDLPISPAQPGLVAGQRAAIFVAASFRCTRRRSDMRSGYKRFGTLGEADIVGDVVEAAALARFNAVSAALAAPVISSGADPAGTWYPQIVRRVKYTTSEGKEAYKVPDVITVNDRYSADEWALQTNLSTQNSRKIGVGA